MSKPSIATACALSVLIAALSLASLPAAAQSPATGAKATTASKVASATPRTPWGDPDLQGSWSTDSAYAIPMQRPAQFAGRAELNDEEFKAKVERDTKARKTAEAVGDGGIGAISSDAAWLTKTFRQTSLIV
jgi:hypothetical protein